MIHQYIFETPSLEFLFGKSDGSFYFTPTEYTTCGCGENEKYFYGYRSGDGKGGDSNEHGRGDSE